MPYATLTFTEPINVSCQVGDIAYYVDVTTQDGFDTGFNDSGVNNSVITIGDIREINNPAANGTYTMIVETSLSGADLGAGSGLSNKFIMFTKDTKANLSSPVGYFASAKFVNTSSSAAEMFSVAMEAFHSSK